jgi:hypothetical protein
MSIYKYKETPEFHLIIFSFLLNLPWELAQLPFFSFKGDDNLGMIFFAVVHCTVGDVLITLSVFEIVSLLNRNRYWFLRWEAKHLSLYVLLGVLYTIFSEMKNVYYYNYWGYNENMPIIPIVEVGLIPVLAWMWIPIVALYMAKKGVVRAKKSMHSTDNA